MYNAAKPAPSDLPSTARLLKSTAIAATTAAVLLLTIVLPAEYGVDPTRVGSVLGLTEMGRIKMQLAEEAAAQDVASAEQIVSEPSIRGAEERAAPSVESAAPAEARAEPEQETAPIWRDEVIFTLAADEAAEYELAMAEGETAKFVWFTDGGRVNYDTHGDKPGLSYHGYDKGSVDRLEGELIAAFDSYHGWFWRNRTGAPLTITLRTRGDYNELKKVM